LLREAERRQLSPPESGAPGLLCPRCRERADSLFWTAGQRLCADCRDEEIKSLRGLFAVEFTARHETAFLLWWFDGLPDTQKAGLIRPALDAAKCADALTGSSAQKKLALAWCDGEDGFLDYVASRL
jgi:hypothetical protein